MSKCFFVFSLFGGNWHCATVRFLGEESRGLLFLFFFELGLSLVDFVDSSVKVLFSFTKTFLAFVAWRCSRLLFFLTVITCHDLFSFLALLESDHVSVEDLDLGHRMDESEAVVGLLGQWVAEKIKLFEESESLEELYELVKVSELIVADQKNLQKLILLNSLDVVESVFLGIHFLYSEVCVDVVQVP